MKVSELLRCLDDYLRLYDDAEVRLYCESFIYDEGFYADDGHEVISDIRVVNDWPLPGESLIVGNSEQPGKYLVIFYDSNDNTKKRLTSGLTSRS